MKKIKIAAILLFTLVLLLSFAYLPEIVSSVQDDSFPGPGFSVIRPVKLAFSDPVETRPLLEKLAIIRDGRFYTVSPGKTNIAQSDIEHVVQDGLNPYYELELVPYNWASYEFSATPHLVYSDTDQDTYAILWVVTIHWPGIGDDLSLYVDDETGRILYLHYNSERPLEEQTDYGYLGSLSTTYLNATGLTEIMNDPGSWAVKDVMKDSSGLKDQHDPWIAYQFKHEEYGTVEIQFWLYQHGFYTLIC